MSSRNIDNIAAEGFESSCGVDMLYELTDTALIVEGLAEDIGAVALVREYYLYACIEYRISF